MERKVLACAVAAGMLAIPASHSAIDDAGMKYTSAGEGFYGSLRTRLISKDANAGTYTPLEAMRGHLDPTDADDTEIETGSDSTDVNASSSRLGVRGSVDLGGGLSANYRYEFAVNPDNDPDGVMGGTRLHNVGLSGSFGSLSFGTQWGLDYNYVWGNTDVMNFHSGGFAYTGERAGRQSNALTYYSPDFGGFDFGLGVVVDAGADTSGGEAETIDEFKVGARYSIQGFTIAGTYVAGAGHSGTEDGVGVDERDANVAMNTHGNDDYVTKNDPKSFGVALGYGQDNWSVSYYYGDTDYGASIGTAYTPRVQAANGRLVGVAMDGMRDPTAVHDPDVIGSEKIHSIAGQFSIDKTTLRAVYETKDNKLEGTTRDTDQVYWTVGVQYDLGSKSRVFAELNGAEDAYGSESSTWEIGHRVDF